MSPVEDIFQVFSLSLRHVDGAIPEPESGLIGSEVALNLTSNPIVFTLEHNPVDDTKLELVRCQVLNKDEADDEKQWPSQNMRMLGSESLIKTIVTKTKCSSAALTSAPLLSSSASGVAVARDEDIGGPGGMLRAGDSGDDDDRRDGKITFRVSVLLPAVRIHESFTNADLLTLENLLENPAALIFICVVFALALFVFFLGRRWDHERLTTLVVVSMQKKRVEFDGLASLVHVLAERALTAPMTDEQKVTQFSLKQHWWDVIKTNHILLSIYYATQAQFQVSSVSQLIVMVLTLLTQTTISA